jgi:hypothetical protein
MQADASEIEPDVKDWPLIIAEGCPECGYDPRSVDRNAIAARMRDTVDRWAVVLARAEASSRPNPKTWSPLEYGCHVRDVALVFGGRIRLMLADEAEFPNWDQDQSAIDGRYGEQVPAEVAVEYADAIAAIADLFDGVAPEQWQRRGLRSDGWPFTVETIGVYGLHDLEHHLYDVSG